MCVQTVLIASQDAELRQGLRLLLESAATAVRKTETAKDTLTQTDDQVDFGDTVTASAICGSGPVERRIMDMGLTKGTSVYVRKVNTIGRSY